MTDEIVQCELIASDLRMVEAMFDVLNEAAGIENVADVRIILRGEGGDTITIGYGEQAEPAILAVKPAPQPGPSSQHRTLAVPTVAEPNEEIEQVRERIARGLYEAGVHCARCKHDGWDAEWDSCAECRWTLLGYAVAVLDALGLEQVGWMVWEDPQDSDSWVAVGLDDEDFSRHPHRPLFTAIPGRTESER